MKIIYLLIVLILSSGLESCQDKSKSSKINFTTSELNQESILFTLFKFHKNKMLQHFFEEGKPENNEETLFEFHQYLKLKNNLQLFFLTTYSQELSIQKIFELEKADDFSLQMFAIRLNYITPPKNSKLQHLIILNKRMSNQISKRREAILLNLTRLR